MDPKTLTLVKTEKHSFLYNIVRRVLLAGVGAAALAEEEIQEFLQRLVERGEIAEQERDSLAAEILDKSRNNLKRVTSLFNSQVEIRSKSESQPSDGKEPVRVTNYNQVKIAIVLFGQNVQGDKKPREES